MKDLKTKIQNEIVLFWEEDNEEKATNNILKLCKEEINKQLSLYGVSQQRELLKAFQEHYQSGNMDDERTFDWNIDNFLKAFNCG